MIVSFRHRLVVLSMPKCASTAIDEALAPHTDIVIRHPPGLKHMTYWRFMRSIMPMIESTGLERNDMEVISLMREPLDWLGSWHRYRARKALRDPAHPNHENYTGSITFEEFMEAYLSDTPPPFARVGDPVHFLRRRGHSDASQCRPLTIADIGPDRTFRYEDGAWAEFLRQRVDRSLEFPTANVSPTGTRAIDSRWRGRLRDQYVLYDALSNDGKIGHLDAHL